MSMPVAGVTAVGAVLLGGGLLALDRIALRMIRPFRKHPRRSVRDLPFPARPHAFTSLGQPLGGWVVEPEADEGGAVVVLVHGWGSSHGRMTYLAGPLLEAGHPVFLFDVRYHGEGPEASYVTARHFRDDTLAAVREVESLFPGRPLVLAGHSMGGSAALLAAAGGAPVEGVVSVAAPANLWEVWANAFNERGLPGRWIVRLLSPFWRLRAGVSFRSLSPELRVREIRVPVLILHGSADRSVDVSHAHVLARGAGVEPVILEGEGHNELLAREKLHQELLDFLEGVRESSSD